MWVQLEPPTVRNLERFQKNLHSARLFASSQFEVSTVWVQTVFSHTHAPPSSPSIKAVMAANTSRTPNAQMMDERIQFILKSRHNNRVSKMITNRIHSLAGPATSKIENGKVGTTTPATTRLTQCRQVKPGAWSRRRLLKETKNLSVTLLLRGL